MPVVTDEQPEKDYTIIYDSAYTEQLNAKVRDQYGPKHDRSGVHATDLLYCLRKAWGKRRVPSADQPELDDETILTWSGGLMFEDLISEGKRQKMAAYCFTCRTVSRVVPPVRGGTEPTHCSLCGNWWLLFTPDYIADDMIHEVKQTRKSRRRGPEDAQWWMDQLRTYTLFANKAGWTGQYIARVVVNWIMGDYGRKKKGLRPLPPKSALDAYLVVFKKGFEAAWESELLRRMTIVLNEGMPVLTGMGEEFGADGISPAYEWECPTCPVGKALGCERWLWGDDDRVIGTVGEEVDDSDEDSTSK